MRECTPGVSVPVAPQVDRGLLDVEFQFEEAVNRAFSSLANAGVAGIICDVRSCSGLGGTAELAFAEGQTVPIARRHVAELARRLGV